MGVAPRLYTDIRVLAHCFIERNIQLTYLWDKKHISTVNVLPQSMCLVIVSNGFRRKMANLPGKRASLPLFRRLF